MYISTPNRLILLTQLAYRKQQTANSAAPRWVLELNNKPFDFFPSEAAAQARYFEIKSAIESNLQTFEYPVSNFVSSFTEEII